MVAGAKAAGLIIDDPIDALQYSIGVDHQKPGAKDVTIETLFHNGQIVWPQREVKQDLFDLGERKEARVVDTLRLMAIDTKEGR